MLLISKQLNEKCLNDVMESKLLSENQKKIIEFNIMNYDMFKIRDQFAILINNVLIVIKDDVDFDMLLSFNCSIYIFLDDDFMVVKTFFYDDITFFKDHTIFNIYDLYNHIANISVSNDYLYLGVYKESKFINLNELQQNQSDYIYDSKEKINEKIVIINDLFEHIIINDEILLLIIDYFKNIEIKRNIFNKFFCGNDDETNIQMLKLAINHN